jgi:hypothetical protein
VDTSAALVARRGRRDHGGDAGRLLAAGAAPRAAAAGGGAGLQPGVAGAARERTACATWASRSRW